MKAFIFEGETYLRCVPVKSLFNSTLVHDVVNRGDIFALRLSDQRLTVIKGTSVVTHLELDAVERKKVDTVTVAKMKKGSFISDKDNRRADQLLAVRIKDQNTKPFDFAKLLQTELLL